MTFPLNSHEFIRIPLAKHASFSGSFVAEVFLALHFKRSFDNAGFPSIKPRDSALRAVTKVAVGIHVLLTRSFFGDGTPRRLLQRVSLAKLTSAPLRF
jgi:hypothetical protein